MANRNAERRQRIAARKLKQTTQYEQEQYPVSATLVVDPNTGDARLEFRPLSGPYATQTFSMVVQLEALQALQGARETVLEFLYEHYSLEFLQTRLSTIEEACAATGWISLVDTAGDPDVERVVRLVEGIVP